VIVKIAVHVAGNFCRLGTKRGAPALQEHDDDNAADARIRVRGEPAEAGSIMRAGSGFPQNLFFVEIEA